MQVTLSWDISNPDPSIRAWRIYGNPDPTTKARGRFLRELPVSESDTTFDVEEGEWEFRILGVKRDETETAWDTATATRSGLFFGRGVKNVPDPPEEIGGGLVGDGELRVQVKTRAPDEQVNKVQLIGGPPTTVYSIAGPGFGHLLDEFLEGRADLLGDDVGRVLSSSLRADGQGMATNRRLWIRAMNREGTPSTSTERTLYPPPRAQLDGRVVASVNGVSGALVGFATPGATDAWEASATYGLRAKKLPTTGSADWADWGTVGGSGIFSGLLTLGRYVDNAKIRTDEIDLGATMLFQLDCYHEAHRRDSAWATKTVREWNSVPMIPGEHRRMRHNRPHAGWTMREILVGGEPRQPLRDVWWEYVAGTSTPVATTEADWKRIVPGQWVSARYFRVRLCFEEPLPWFRFASGNVQVAVLRPRLVETGASSPEASVHAPLGATYLETTSVPPRTWKKTTQTGNTGWARTDVPLLDSVNGAISVPNTTTLTAIYTKSIAAGVLGTQGRVRVKLFGYYTNNSGGNRDLLVEVLFGSTSVWKDTISGIPTSAVNRAFSVELDLIAYGSTTSQKISGRLTLGDATAPTTGVGSVQAPLVDAIFHGASSEVTTGALSLVVKAQHSVADTTIVIIGATAEQLMK